MLIRNPFILHVTADGIAPTDGKGLNPTLHNIWMSSIHRFCLPVLPLMAVPFGYAIAGLWRRDYDGWVQVSLATGRLPHGRCWRLALLSVAI
jgi:cytochrome c-type biogenesis protein CcmF